MADFIPVLIEDSRISKITDKVVFGVSSSGSASTFQQFQATSASNSSIVYSIQVPSENICISRYVLHQSTLTFTVGISGVPMDEIAFQYGLTDSLQSFPLHSLFTTQQLTINNVSTSTNTQDVLPMLLRMTDMKELSKHHMTSPSFVDSAYGMFSDAVGANNNPLSGFKNCALDSDIQGRGSYPVNIQILHYVDGIGAPDNSVVSTGENDTWKIVITGTFTEPFLCLSPFLSTPNATNDAGLIGINNMSLVLNIDSTCKRLFSTANLSLIHT